MKKLLNITIAVLAALCIICTFGLPFGDWRDTLTGLSIASVMALVMSFKDRISNLEHVLHKTVK